MRVFLLFVVLAAVASGQTAEEILSQTAATYQALQKYHLEAQVVSENDPAQGVSRTVGSRVAAASLPDLRHIELRDQQLGEILSVYDGHTVWDFHSGPNQFARTDQAAYNPSVTVGVDPVDTYKRLDKSAGSAALKREDAIEIGGAQHPCWVVNVTSQARIAAGGQIQEVSPTTYWIDKSTHLVLNESFYIKIKPRASDTVWTTTTTTTYSLVSVNEPVAPELFEFQTPEGATEVAGFTSAIGPGQPMPDTPAPYFTLRDLQGKEVAWSSLKGRPVLLVDFWGTWCTPCKAEMPKIEEVRRQFGDKDLVVLTIDENEEPEKARQYMADNGFTFQVLIDPNGEVKDKFSVAGFPSMFLIDRDGNMRQRIAGYSAQRDLKSDLKIIGFNSATTASCCKEVAHAPLTLPGMLSTARHWDQSRVVVMFSPSFRRSFLPQIGGGVTRPRRFAGRPGRYSETSVLRKYHDRATHVYLKDGKMHDGLRRYVLDRPPVLRQTVKTQNPLNGELSHGSNTQAVHAGV